MFSRLSVVIPFLRIRTLMMIAQCTGMSAIGTFNIFMDSGSSINPELAPILVFTIRQFLALVSTGLLKVSPRRPLFFICASMIGCSMAGLGTYSFLTQGVTNPSGLATNGTVSLDDTSKFSFGLVPVTCVVAVNAFMSLGYMSILQLLLAESFPTEIR